MNRRLETVLSVILTLCAVAVTATFVVRRSARVEPLISENKPAFVQRWETLVSPNALRIGSASAPIQIVEFADFECPYCRIFHESVDAIMKEFPGQVSLVFLHYPLAYHRFAGLAAGAAECAAEQGRFTAMAQVIFAHQDSLGLTPWHSLAQTASVADTARFSSCMHDESVRSRIRTATALGDSLGVEGTPTVIINGWRYPHPPPADSLRYIIREVVAGRSPWEPGDL